MYNKNHRFNFWSYSNASCFTNLEYYEQTDQFPILGVIDMFKGWQKLSSIPQEELRQKPSRDKEASPWTSHPQVQRAWRVHLQAGRPSHYVRLTHEMEQLHRHADYRRPRSLRVMLGTSLLWIETTICWWIHQGYFIPSQVDLVVVYIFDCVLLVKFLGLHTFLQSSLHYSNFWVES